MNKKYRVHELARLNYSDIGEYIDEDHTDRPLRNDILVNLLNNKDDQIRELQERNDRQKERLDNLYELILNRDYDGQEELIKELEEYEQLLQEELKLYCG